MVPASENPDLLLSDLIDKPMFLIYSPRPTTLEFVFEWLRLADSFERVTLHVVYEINDSYCLVAVLALYGSNDLKARITVLSPVLIDR